MFLQHMLAVTRDGGMVATVMPHGVLFRGGEEKTIRAGIIDDDLLEAVIGVAPNLFYGTGIPACILVLRQQVQNGAHRVSGKPAERQGKVLFINADREFFEGRAQNYLLPEHIEKIVTTFDEFRAIAGFSAIVDNATLKANDYNLNIRRYADNAPPPEPHDVRAHLVGGVPKAEVADKAALFQAHGLNPLDLLVERDAKYFDFKPELTKRQDLKPAIEGNAGLVAKEAAIRAAFEQWWQAHSARITALAGQMDNAASLVALRNDLLASFSDIAGSHRPARPLPGARHRRRLLVPDQVRLPHPDGARRQGRGRRLAHQHRHRAGRQGQQGKPAGAQARQVPDERLRRGHHRAGGEEGRAGQPDQGRQPQGCRGRGRRSRRSRGRGADDENAVDEAQLKAWKKELTAVKKQLKAKKESFAAHINAAVDGLSPSRPPTCC